ncbi:MAG: response regulator transcription factor [Chloroflexota bacterium]|nr:response regulator transcription factor [Chloroflexota bacterium]
MARILIVEDSVDLARALRTNLELEGHTVEVALDGERGLSLARSSRPDLIVLDLMLPKVDGYLLLRAVRGEGLQMPVLILTARSDEAEKVRGFRWGADDYVTKPFSLIELLARIEALLRRSRQVATAAEAGDSAVRFGAIEVHPAKRLVMRKGAPVALRPKEFDLLMALVRRDGSVAQRAELLREVWGYKPAMVSRTIDTHIVELRRKLEDDPSSPRHFLTVRKTGYRFER